MLCWARRNRGIFSLAHRFNSREAAKARRVKGARRGHATVRAQGRVPGEWLTPARMKLRAARKAEAEAANKVQGHADLPSSGLSDSAQDEY